MGQDQDADVACVIHICMMTLSECPIKTESAISAKIIMVHRVVAVSLLADQSAAGRGTGADGHGRRIAAGA